MDSDKEFNEEILNLIKQGESDGRINEILQEACLYNSSDASGKTLLHYSALYNNANLTQNLLNKGCNVDMQDSMGNTPLMIAMMQDNDEIMETLIAAGANIFKVNNENKSPLNMVGELHMKHRPTIQIFFKELKKKCSTSEETAKELIDAGCYLYQAAMLTDAKILEDMLKQGCSVDFPHLSTKITALHVSARLNDLDSVNVLLKYGADVNALDYHNENCLFNIYKQETEHNSEKVEILKAILNKGASMTSCSSTGIFQVTCTLNRGNHKAMRVLLESWLDFNVKDARISGTVLHYLATNSNPGLDEELKPFVDKFDVNVVDKFGRTPLFIAAFHGNINLVKFFLKQGARPNVKHCRLNTTPLYYAYGNKNSDGQYKECGQLLLEYDADPQFIVINKRNQAETIIDSALKDKDLARIEPVIAHLAIIEKRGSLITEATKTAINSDKRLKKYFDECRKIITERVSERIVLFDLLTSDKRKMARYLDNNNIIQKLRDNELLMYKIKKHRYYCNILNKRYSNGNRYKKLKIKASSVICKLFQKRINKTHLVIDNIIHHLNDRSLRQLSLLHYQLSYHRNNRTSIKK